MYSPTPETGQPMEGENHYEHVDHLARAIGIIHFASLAMSAPRFEPIENGIFDGIGDEEISIWIAKEGYSISEKEKNGNDSYTHLRDK